MGRQGKDSRSAGNVENLVALADLGGIRYDGTPLPEQRRDKQLVIHFCRCARSVDDVHGVPPCQGDVDVVWRPLYSAPWSRPMIERPDRLPDRL